ncbi:cyclic nucleotide-binding protein [Treponema primitia ZAS-2]|uniref:Cyclic nucleotide-binding protein n=1 Tax=Treponema primitia (strain ATCC BAA-887 / DSM 12427 / ZAS-2) TaxID=545694 RepID=F5YNM3_TREPZ|nr:Crp/Fnr family transcriptional regulator [Treponema primitia]AEF85789.1 cyclic nucleotide-binding protein [Treponema primitia ZAS-2]
MKKYLPLLARCPLFKGIAGPDLVSLLECLSARHKKYEKDSFVFMADDEPRFIGVVLSGALHILQDDFWGNRVILARAEPGELFGEAFSCGGVKKLPVSVQAVEKSEVLLIDLTRIITTCSSVCVFHRDLIKNTLQDMARKNIALIKKMEHITRRTTREKLLSYLSSQAQQQGSTVLTIPFKRQELAEYLSVDRSAMSAELGKMQDQGLIRFNKNRFELLQKN